MVARKWAARGIFHPLQCLQKTRFANLESFGSARIVAAITRKLLGQGERVVPTDLDDALIDSILSIREKIFCIFASSYLFEDSMNQGGEDSFCMINLEREEWYG